MDLCLEEPSVYILILNWNNVEDTILCVKSCLNVLYENKYLVVIDNGSNDHSRDLLSEWEGTIEILYLDKNVGFGGGNNEGIRYAIEKGADFIWLLNNDTIVSENSLALQLSAFKNIKPRPAILGSKILLTESPHVVDFIGGAYDSITGEAMHLGRGQFDGEIDCDFSIESDFITGCSMLFPSSLIDEMGFFRSDYFLYCEDVEFSARAKALGYRLIVNCESVIFHQLSSTTKRKKGAITYYVTRNTLYLLEDVGGISCLSLRKRIYSDVVLVFKCGFGFNFRAIYSVLKAYVHWFCGFTGSFNESKRTRRLAIFRFGRYSELSP